MSRSIEFRMYESQEEKFIKFLNESPDIVMISASSDACYPRIIKDFYKKGENIFWNKAYITQTGEVDKIRMTYVKSCRHYIIEDTFEAPVIEIRRGVCSKGGNARLCAEFYFYRDGEKVYKGEELEKLYKKLETWIEINYSDIILDF